MNQIDAVDEPLSALNGLLGCLCHMDSHHDSPVPRVLSDTLYHLYDLSSEAKKNFEVLALELSADTPKVQEEPATKAKSKKKGV